MPAKRINIILLGILLMAMAACSSEGCYEDTESNLSVTLRETDNEDVTSIDSLTVYGLGIVGDSLYKDANTGSLQLPLNPGAVSAVFIVKNGTIRDTLTVGYSGRYNFVSKGCGYNYLYTIESVSFTRNRIDTVLIINNSVTPDDEENLRAFF